MPQISHASLHNSTHVPNAGNSCTGPNANRRPPLPPPPPPPSPSRCSRWVEPTTLPSHGDVSSIGGNAPYWVKHLSNNTFMSYGVGDEECFAYNVGKSVRFLDVSLRGNEERAGDLEARTVAEVIVTKSTCSCLSGSCFSF
jgi:acyl-coenzyme A thioesterase 13